MSKLLLKWFEHYLLQYMSLVKLLTMEPGDETIGYTCKIGTLVLGLYATQTSDLSIKGLIVDKNCSVRPDNY